MRKRVLSLFLVLSMLAAYVPAVLATGEATAPADVVYDFTSLPDNWKLSADTTPSALEGKNFSLDTSSGASDWKKGANNSGGYLRVNVNATWIAASGSRSTKAAIKIQVPESGWYAPSFTGGLSIQGLKASIYLGTSYLGDYDFTTDDTSTSNVICIIGEEKKLNAVYLEAGEHTVYFCFREVIPNTGSVYPFFINFKLAGLSAKPEITDAETEIPSICAGDEAQCSVEFKVSDGSSFAFADYEVAEKAVIKNALDGNYIKVVSEDEAVVAVSDVKCVGVGHSERYTYTITGTGSGTTNLLFTPYINGVAGETCKKAITVSEPPKLEKIVLETNFDELSCGRDATASITSFIRDDGGEYTGAYEATFTTDNDDVLEIVKTDSDSCKIIAKGIGTANVIASVMTEDLQEPIVKSAELTVLERPVLEEIELSAERSVLNIGDSSVVTIAALLMNDGLPAFEDNEYEFFWENDNEEAVSFDEETGKIEAIALGTAEIRASTVNENGKKVYGKLLISVVEKSDEPVSDKSIVIDFGETVTEKINNAWTVVSTPGYEVVRSKSNMGTWISAACPDGVKRLRINAGATNESRCWPNSTSANASVTFNVEIPESGYYAVFFTGGVHNRGTIYSSYLDGSVYLGDYDFRGPNAVDKADGGERKQFNTVYLTASEHEITFRGRTYYSNPYISLEKLEFIPIDITELSPGELVAESEISLAVGEKLSDSEAYVKMSDGSPYSFGYTGEGKENASNYFDIKAADESISVVYDSEYTAGDTEIHRFDVIGVSEGASEIVLKSYVNNSEPVTKTIPVTVTNEKLASVQIGSSKKFLFADETATLSAKILLDSGRIPLIDSDAIVYSSESDAVKVEGDEITAVRTGTAEITVTVTLGDIIKTDSITVTVFDGGVADMKITAGGSRYIRIDDVVPIYVTGIMPDGLEFDMTGAECLSYSSLTPEVCDVDEQGNIIPKETGKAKLRVTETTVEGSKSFTAELEIIEGKQGFTIYTEDERNNARENAKKYSWAKEMVITAEESAEKYADMLDVLYEGLPSEGVMRSYTVGEFNDPEKYYCRYCGKNLLPEYGDPPFVIDPVSRPWKIQCPDCKRLFPSNDFGSFYQLGLNEYGEFDRIRALEAHRDMLLEKGKIDTSVEAPGEEYSDSWYTYYGYGVEGGYLFNELYSELYDATKSSCDIDPVKGETVDGERWGVDDGFGYMPGRSYYSTNSSGQQVKLCDERHNYIAYYLHYFYYQYYRLAITKSAEAYLYTGEPTYGYTTAILLDRLADFYPSYDLSLYGTKIWASHGGLYNGKYMGSITESNTSADIAAAYDAIYTLYDSDYVMNYISNRCATLKMRHAKGTPSQVRTNVEDGVLREMLESCTNGDIRGNFGFSQTVMAAAAIALDNGKETNDWLDFLVKPGFVRIGEVTGGGLYDWLITYVDGDGQPNEASLYSYNWAYYLLNVQNYLNDYTSKYSVADLSTYPRYIKLLRAFIPTILSSYNANYGDSSSWTIKRNIWYHYAPLISGYRWTGDTVFLKVLYMKVEGDVSKFNEGIFVKDPEQIQKETLRVIEEEGRLDLPSQIMTQFGFSVLRDGADHTTNYGTRGNDFRRNFWMYFGYNGGHGHRDSLNLGMDAFGYNFMPDLGYPETTGTQPNRMQWINATISHNTVVVDEDNQTISDKRANPLHFDDTEMVKLMDVDAKEVYPQTDIYRRSVLMIKIDDQISYGVDFFRVKGGDIHELSLHTTSDEVYEVSGLGAVEKQTDGNGNYIGTYASPDYKYGEDPVSPNASTYKTFYPRGYTWLEKVDRYRDPEEKFEVDFEIKDFEKMLVDGRGLHLRATMLGVDTSNTDIAFADGYPARTARNNNIPSFRYMFVKRTGENLDSLFTTVLEPYRNNRTLSDITELSLVKKSGYEDRDDEARAVRVTHVSGRVDYIFYATNNAITYSLTDGERTIDFRGFAGVYTVQNGENTYRYVCDGDIIGESVEEVRCGISGRVADFTEGIAWDHEITVIPEGEVSQAEVDMLAGKCVLIENDGIRNGAYWIRSAELCDGKLVLNIGDVSLIRALLDSNDMNSGFTYNIAARQDVYIPLSYSEDEATPYFTEFSDKLSVSAGSSLKASFTAESPMGYALTYKGTVLPRGASVDENTGELRWKPDASQVGDNHVAVTVYDEFGRQATVNVMISVYGSTTGSTAETGETEASSTGNANASSGGGGGGGGGADVPDSEDAVQTDETDSGENSPDASGETETLRFTDLGNHAWARDAINTLADDGIIKGTTATTFSPADNITRADFALLLVRAFKLTSDNTESFADVSASDYFAPELAIARNTGIVQGIGDNRYAPRNTITRQDMMVIVYRALQTLSVAVGDSSPGGRAEIEEGYADFVSVAPYAKDAVASLIGAGVVNGKNGRIAPTDYTTRAEVAVLIKRIMDYTKK